MKMWIGLPLILLLWGCKPDKKVEYVKVDTSTPIQGKSIKYLALGDSYTIGTAIGTENSYATLLADSLQSEKEIGKVKLEIIAKNGWTTGNLLNGISTENPANDYDVVSLLIGVNNQYQHLSKIQYRQQFRALLEQSINFAANDTSRVFVLNIPDYGVTPAGGNGNASIAADIENFNRINKEISDSMGVSYLDIYSVSKTALNHPDLIAPDGLHFSARMHQLWLKIIYKPIKEALLKP